MSNRRKPSGPAIARRFPLQLNEGRSITRRQMKAIRRSAWVLELRCAWDSRLGRDEGCHVRRRYHLASCPTHPQQPVNFRGRAA